MLKLNRQTVKENHVYPSKIMQFGEGNFLRAFVDWIIQNMNEKINFNSGVDIIQPLAKGMVPLINEQQGLYHVYLKGMKEGTAVREFKLVECINKGINPYTDQEDYEKAIINPELRFVVSNTTEAGIAFDPNDQLEMTPPNSFPAKVTSLLYKRYKTFKGAEDKGLIFFTCELIDKNGDNLKKFVFEYAKKWELEAEFVEWIKQNCAFCNTLVDRIVPGFPRDEIKSIQNELGYEDQLVVVGEYFHLWVIEAPDWVKKEFPANKAGLQVEFVSDITPFRNRKVRILNGAHTGSFAVSLLAGVPTVKETIEHPQLGTFMKEMIYSEVVTGLNGNENELKDFATHILERFYNPFIKHQWTSIALNALSKWETRCLPSLIDFKKITGELPDRIVFSLAALIAYYRGNYHGTEYNPTDNPENLEFFKNVWAQTTATPQSIYHLVTKVLSSKELWKMDLTEIEGLTAAVSGYLFLIEKTDVLTALKAIPATKESAAYSL